MLLGDYIRSLEQEIDRLDPAQRRLLMTAIEAWNAYGKAIAPVKTGRLQLTQHVESVVQIGAGVLEAASVPGVPYAEPVATRYGAAAYDERTMRERPDVLEDLARDLETLYQQLFEGTL